MTRSNLTGFAHLWLAWMGMVLLASSGSFGAETNSVAEAQVSTNAPASADTDATLRAYLRLQEQLHATLLAIEQTRLEFSQEARSNAEALAARLELVEESLARQRESQWQTLHESNRAMFMLAGGIVGLGLLALACAAVFQSRGINRLAEIATGLAGERRLLAGSLMDSTVPSEKLLLGGGPGMGPGQQWSATIRRLEQRIQDLEQTAKIGLAPVSNGEGDVREIGHGSSTPVARDHLSALLGKAQVLLSLGQSEAALSCYDEALVEAPDHAEAHVKKGMALERLKRFVEAIGCYDRAIALNPSLTRAYLCKGAVFNRQERYNEALECYEQALRSESRA
jgi:tetratricopeptide (TPR) repeat protein